MAKTPAVALADLKKTPQEYPETVAGQLQRIEDSKVVIAAKAHELTLTDSADVTIDRAAIAISDIIMQGAYNKTLTETVNYLPEGYYTGGTITVGQISDGYYLQEKSWTPTEAPKTLEPDDGFYGLSKVTVAAIPSKYKDLTNQTITAADVLSPAKFIDKNTGNVVTGTMPDRGELNLALTIDDGDYGVGDADTAGYYNSVYVHVRSTEMEATPSEQEQVIEDTLDSLYLTKVTVKAIDKPKYLTQWTADGTATSDQILLNQIAYVNGAKITGTMPNNAAFTGTDPDNTKQYVLTTEDDLETVFDIPQGYHPYATQVLLHGENKSVTPTATNQTVTATSGKVLHSVTVQGMPGVYINAAPITNLTAAASRVRASDKFIGSAGLVETGTMPDATHTKVTNILNMTASGLTVHTYTAGYTEAGSVVLDATLYNALAAI